MDNVSSESAVGKNIAADKSNDTKRRADESVEVEETHVKKVKLLDGSTTNVGEENRPNHDAKHTIPQNKVHQNNTVSLCQLLGKSNITVSAEPNEKSTFEADYESEFSSLVNLTPVPDSAPPPIVTDNERRMLERDLQFDDVMDDGWRADWSGNLQLLDKEIMVADLPHAKPSPRVFHEWVSEAMSKSPQALQSVRLLLSYVYHMKDTPDMARKILAYSLNCPAKNDVERLEIILNAVRRTLYDPVVLKQDGWTTKKALTAEGASGGAHLIGRKIIWEKYDAIVIGFVHDDEIGDLWKAMWLEDRETFDLEADELWTAIKKWENREGRKNKQQVSRSSSSADLIEIPQPRGYVSHRNQQNVDFTVAGIEHGIVLAISPHPNARNGVLWPARVMHVSELNKTGAPREPGTRRGASKRYVSVVFLAPYWNGQLSSKGRSSGGGVTNSMTTAKSVYSTGPLFEIETVEPSETTIMKYPFDDSSCLHVDKAKEEFKYLGLPKAAFPRFLDSHRLALALKNYSKHYIHENSCYSGVDAFASLTDCHQMSIKTPLFPSALLNLPYDYILSKLMHSTEQLSNLTNKDDAADTSEPVLQLYDILQCMAPPYCFGIHVKTDNNSGKENGLMSQSKRISTPMRSPCEGTLSGHSEVGDTLRMNHFASECLLQALSHGDESLPSLSCAKLLSFHLSALVLDVNEISSGIKANMHLRREEKKAKLNVITNECLSSKSFGEDVISSVATPHGPSSSTLVIEWRKACERVYRHSVGLLSSPGFGNGVTVIVTDSRCNQHITSAGCFERAMRIPAAIRGAKRAGAGADVNIPLIYYVNESYVNVAEKNILPRVHKDSYLKRLKSKISSIPPNARGVPLTDDSDGEGGSDTRGSRGSYMAAVSGVAASLQAVDMVVKGECVSAFCATRPPGHHAGRELRAMNAVSNGFCLLNNAACAALYAVTPRNEGGRGLKRVCIIDFDVHHGNGTQDILCSTYDSRFFYVSLHAGGAHINGFETNGSDSEDQDFKRILGGSKQDGIYPGRCGDHSPHSGVLNIPLGPKVTAHAIGTALMTEVAPAVEAFSPDLIILSSGFDAHKHDPMGLGSLSAEDFGSVTDVACQMAMKVCSGRVVSVLEGGYGVPCCQPSAESFIPPKYLDLGKDVPEGMMDDVSDALKQKLEKCYSEGFLDCVKAHVTALSRSSRRQ